MIALVRSALGAYLATPGLFAAALAGIAYQVGFNLFLPLMTKRVFDDVLPARDGRLLGEIALALAAALAGRFAAALLAERAMARVTAHAMAARRARMFSALLAKPAAFHARVPAAEVLAKFSTDLGVVEGATARQVPRAIQSALNVIGCSTLMIVLDVRLAAVIALMLALVLLGPRKLSARAAANNTRRREAESRLLATVQETVALHSVIRAFAVERWVRGTHDAKLDTFREQAARTTAAGSYVDLFTVFSFLLVQLLVLCTGAWLVIRGDLSAGQLVAFTSLVGSVSGSIFGLSSMLPPLIESAAGFARVESIFEPEPAPGSEALPELHGGVTLDHVSFSYTGERADLRDVSLEIAPGTSAAFVGPSGSGKSTALSLITRANAPQAGRVLVDGHDLARISSASLYAQMALVAQESLLFDTTIRENIRVGRLDASDAEVEAAARKAEIHDAILAMPRGYDTPVGERGSKLSGGQRQRIAIARAVLREPKLLVLDEATSALDPVTEQAVARTLDKLGEGRTIISVTHRLATVQHYDRIFVMSSGELVDSGSHAELVQREGLYRQLWAKQHGVSLSSGGHASVTPELLASMPVLSALDDVARQDLAGRFVTMTYGEGHELFRAGDPGDAFYVIARGEITIEIASGDKRVERVLSEGDGFGEIALLSPTPRTATARTRTACTLLVLPRDVFATMIERYPALAEQLRAKADAHLAADRSA